MPAQDTSIFRYFARFLLRMFLAIFGDVEKQPLNGRGGVPLLCRSTRIACERRIAAEWAENQGEGLLWLWPVQP